MAMRYLFAILLFTLSGCAYFGARPAADLTGLERARSTDRMRLDAEAGAVTGAYVCKQYTVGIADTDWVKGTVVEAKSDGIRVKIDDPGKFPHDANGTEMAKGSLVWDKGVGWTPCVKDLAGHSEMN